MPKHRRNVQLSPRAFSLGGLERYGDDKYAMQITREHGAYIVRGFCPDAKLFGGRHVVEGFRTLIAARKFARDCLGKRFR